MPQAELAWRPWQINEPASEGVSASTPCENGPNKLEPRRLLGSWKLPAVRPNRSRRQEPKTKDTKARNTFASDHSSSRQCYVVSRLLHVECMTDLAQINKFGILRRRLSSRQMSDCSDLGLLIDDCM
jgi:hypothetical protein